MNSLPYSQSINHTLPPVDAATIHKQPQAAGGQAGEDGRGAGPAVRRRRRGQGAGHRGRRLRPVQRAQGRTPPATAGTRAGPISIPSFGLNFLGFNFFFFFFCTFVWALYKYT